MPQMDCVWNNHGASLTGQGTLGKGRWPHCATRPPTVPGTSSHPEGMGCHVCPIYATMSFLTKVICFWIPLRWQISKSVRFNLACFYDDQVFIKYVKVHKRVREKKAKLLVRRRLEGILWSFVRRLQSKYSQERVFNLRQENVQNALVWK